MVEPHFVKGLDNFAAFHEGPYGYIQSYWVRTPGQIVYTISVPPNSTATLRLLIDKNQKLYSNHKLLSFGTGIFMQKLKAGTYLYTLE